MGDALVTTAQEQKVDYDRVRLMVRAQYDRYNIEIAQSAARFRDLRVGGSDGPQDSWLYTAHGKERRCSTKSGGNYPGATGPEYLASWFRASPCENLDGQCKLMLNYFYNVECPRELDTFKTLYGQLWTDYRQTLKSKKPDVMVACYDMLGEMLHRYRRRWIKGVKFKDFEWDDVATPEGGLQSRSTWYNVYRDHWLKLRQFVERQDERCLDTVRAKL